MLSYLIQGFLVLCIATTSWGQESNQHYLFDFESKRPIGDAFIFIDQGDINSISNEKGHFSLSDNIPSNEPIYFSHVNYGLHQLSFSELLRLDTIFLKANTLELPQLQISATSTKKRNRWLKKFNRSFLGEDYKKYSTYIVNEDAVLFSESKGDLHARSNDLLEIINEKLGYKIYYWLEEFNRVVDGKVNYQGKYSFEPIVPTPKDVAAARQAAYINSMAHFLKSIIEGNYKHFYEVRVARLKDDGTLMNMGKVNIKGILSFDENSELYTLKIPEFLEIEHLNLATTSFKSDMRGVSGIGNRTDQELVKDGMNKKGSTATHKTSLLFSNANQLLFDKNGMIQNSQYIQRYGYWASQGMANVLPSTFATDTGVPSDQLDESDQVEFLVRNLLDADEHDYLEIFKKLKLNWSQSIVSPLAEIMIVTEKPKLLFEINQFLKRQTKVNPGSHGLDWLQWAWKQNTPQPNWYANFKADLYQLIDERFHTYFYDRAQPNSIRLDEIIWGGVKQDGIPPLRFPALLEADDANYLSDDDIVFGIVHNNIPRAYPQRILGWHEMVVDQFGQDTITGVYCTLCGTMIAYNNRSTIGHHDLGTSGFLYRSNKLMYDQKTQSLWSTIEGKPVIGPLVNKGIQLDMLPVVTTTWKDWKSQYPESNVLSIQTGFSRNYTAGAAYKKYFSHDNLMFPVPLSDSRLRNKDVVFVIRSFDKKQPIAFEKSYLIKKQVVHHTVADDNIVIITNKQGKTMAYNSDNYIFKLMSNGQLVDQFEGVWELQEESLQHVDNNTTLAQLPGHEIFWFAWVNVFPKTALIK